MDWLGQNWIWIALAVGAFFFMTRMGGCGMGRSAGHHHNDESRDNPPPSADIGAGSAFDPVSRHAITAGGPTISSVYRGRVFYFESRANRDLFESDPEKYLADSSSAGQPIEREHDFTGERRHRHGC